MGKFRFLNGMWPFATKTEETKIEEIKAPIVSETKEDLSGRVLHGKTSRNELNEALHERFSGIDNKVSGIEEELNSRLLKIEKNIEILANKNKELITTISENIEDEGDDLDGRFELLEKKLETVEKVFDEKLKGSLQRNVELRRINKDLEKKYEAILDILAEKQAENKEPLPNLFVGDISLREMWRKHSGSKDAILYSIAYMLKKGLEEKGTRLK